MTKLGDISTIITGPFGSQLHQSDYVSDGVPIVMPQDITDRKINYTSINYISEYDAHRLNRYITQKNDILYARRGDIEKHAFITSEDSGVYCGTGCLRVRITSEDVDPLFLSFYLNREETKRWLVTHAVGSNMPNLNTEILSNVPISYPTIDRQKRIAHILNCLDKKITTNRKINDNLENQIQTIYDYWFSQFDFPDSDGNPYKSNGGLLEWNETLKRNIPSSWSVGSVAKNSLTKFIKPGVDVFELKTYLATADVKGSAIYEGTVIDYENRESRANMQPTEYSVWFAKMKNSIKHLYFNPEMYPIIEQSILSTGFCGLQCDDKSFEYISSYIASPYFELHKDMLAHGATQEAVNNNDLAEIHLLIPDKNTLEKYHKATQPIYAQIAKNICENKELTKLRDWLLPMLMNGQAIIED